MRSHHVVHERIDAVSDYRIVGAQMLNEPRLIVDREAEERERAVLARGLSTHGSRGRLLQNNA